VKFRDDRGEWLDIEATSGIVVNDAFYRRKLSISPAALKNGIYLCPLAPKEAVAALLEPLMASYGRRDPQKIIEVAGMALGANSKDTSAMIYIADGYYDLFKQRYVDRYPDPKNSAGGSSGGNLDESPEFLLGEPCRVIGMGTRNCSRQDYLLQSVAREKARREGQK